MGSQRSISIYLKKCFQLLESPEFLLPSLMQHGRTTQVISLSRCRPGPPALWDSASATDLPSHPTDQAGGVPSHPPTAYPPSDQQVVFDSFLAGPPSSHQGLQVLQLLGVSLRLSSLSAKESEPLEWATLPSICEASQLSD